MIPSSRSVLSRDKRFPLNTWNSSGLQENVFGNQFSTFDLRRDHPQGINSIWRNTMRKWISSKSYRDRFFSQEMTNNIEAHFQCRHLQQGHRLLFR